jgi:cell division protein FtsB
MTLLEKVASWLYRSRRKLATGGAGLLACLMAYHVVFGANGLLIYQQKRHDHQELQQQIESLQQQNQSLEHQIKALKSDPQAIEKEAREHLRYVREGEVVYTLPSKPATSVVPVKK